MPFAFPLRFSDLQITFIYLHFISCLLLDNQLSYPYIVFRPGENGRAAGGETKDPLKTEKTGSPNEEANFKNDLNCLP